jgi:hypothetical protein
MAWTRSSTLSRQSSEHSINRCIALVENNLISRVESADDRRAQARQVRVEKRAALLADGFTMPEGEMVNLRDRKKLRMLARGAIE